MIVTMRRRIGGYRNGEAWPAPGGTIDVPDHEAADLIANGYAMEAIDAPDTPTPVVDDAEPSDVDGPAGAADDDTPVPADDDAAPADPDPADKPVTPRRSRKA